MIRTRSGHQDRGRTNREKRAFTLIELLVVIAIIAILAAILFPVFARARENARRASCQSNLKQIGLGIIQYRQDYDERFPPFNFTDAPPNASHHKGWARVIQPYVKSHQIMQCPSEPNKANFAIGGNDVHVKGYGDYFYNSRLGPYNQVGKNESEIVSPSLVIMNGDSGGARDDGEANCFDTSSCGSGSYPPGTYTWDPVQTNIDPTNAAHNVLWQAVMKRHLDGANYGFVDGHVKWLKPDAVTYDDPATGSKATFRIN